MTHTADDLEEQFYVTNAAQLQRWLPWLRMFRAFRIAIGLKCMLLGLAAILIWPLGDLAIRSLLENDTPTVVSPPSSDLSVQIQVPKFLFQTVFDGSSNLLLTLLNEQSIVLKPLTDMFVRGAMVVRGSSPGEWGSAVLILLWSLIVWAVFGGAIARITSHEMTGNGSLSLFGSVKFSCRRIVSYLSSPLLTLVGIGMCWIPLVFAGLIGRIPVAGEFLLGALWCLALVAGLFMALIVIGVSLGWPLMFATISVEASDAFDGLSRAYGYIFNRPWYTLFLMIIMCVYGAILSHFVIFVQQLAIQFTDQSVSTGLGAASLSDSSLTLINSWMKLVQHLPTAFLYSFFWVSMTIIYILLRHREDGTPFFVMGQDKLAPRTLPLSGIPAAELRETNIMRGGDAGE